jgi:hypothetical protein
MVSIWSYEHPQKFKSPANVGKQKGKRSVGIKPSKNACLQNTPVSNGEKIAIKINRHEPKIQNAAVHHISKNER